MNNKRIPLATPHMSDDGYEKEFVKEAFDTNWIAPLGVNVNEFEKELAAYVKTTNAAALYSGTGAIHMALKACGVKKDDIVICQDLTFSATVNPIIYENAIPVLVDSDFETWNMCPNALRKALEKYPNAKAVIVVNLYGLSANFDEICKICEEFKVTLIEDAAESLGTTYKDKFTGTFGTYGIYSFNGNKIITTSGGGMLVCNDSKISDERINKVRFWSTQAREQARHYEHKEIGYNYRMSNVVAGIGRGQLKVLEQRVSKKRYIYNYYQKKLSKLKGFSLMPIDFNGRSNCWLSSAVINANITSLEVIIALEKENIESRPIWKPMHLQEIFKDYDYIDNGGVGKYLFENGLCLPSDTKMTDEDLEKVCNVIINNWK